MTPVCITGMHRSGTSMVARLLNLCGLYLGPESELLNAAPDNPEGYWENARFVEIDQVLLARAGGAWDVPPSLPSGWELASELEPLRAQARELIAGFATCERWGWKDPRASLTLPFWHALMPDLRVVVCVRSPLDVAQSLHRRGYSSNLFGFQLWQTYNERLLAATAPDRRFVTHQDSYFSHPENELRRLLNWLSWPVAEATIAEACGSIAGALRHSRTTRAELEAARPSAELLALYDRLCAEAGTMEEATESAPARSFAVQARPEALSLEQLAAQQHEQIGLLEQERQRLQQALELQGEWAKELERAAREYQATLHAYERWLWPLLFPLRLVRRALGRARQDRPPAGRTTRRP